MANLHPLNKHSYTPTHSIQLLLSPSSFVPRPLTKVAPQRMQARKTPQSSGAAFTNCVGLLRFNRRVWQITNCACECARCGWMCIYSCVLRREWVYTVNCSEPIFSFFQLCQWAVAYLKTPNIATLPLASSVLCKTVAAKFSSMHHSPTLPPPLCRCAPLKQIWHCGEFMGSLPTSPNNSCAPRLRQFMFLKIYFASQRFLHMQWQHKAVVIRWKRGKETMKVIFVYPSEGMNAQLPSTGTGQHGDPSEKCWFQRGWVETFMQNRGERKPAQLKKWLKAGGLQRGGTSCKPVDFKCTLHVDWSHCNTQNSKTRQSGAKSCSMLWADVWM